MCFQFKCSLTWSCSTKAKSSLLQTFTLVSVARDSCSQPGLWRLRWRRQWVPWHCPCHLSPVLHLIQQWPHIFPILLYAVYLFAEALLLAFHIPCQSNPKSDMAFLALPLQFQTAAQHFSWVICPCFHLFYISLSCQNSLRSSWFIYALCRPPATFSWTPDCWELITWAWR